jgi:hypothetical protein
MAGSGLSFVALSSGKNVVRTGTEFVNDPESGQPIEQPRFSSLRRPGGRHDHRSWVTTAMATP